MYLGHVATCTGMIEYDRPPHIEYYHLLRLTVLLTSNLGHTQQLSRSHVAILAQSQQDCNPKLEPVVAPGLIRSRFIRRNLFYFTY